ncbi:MAG: glycosyltransferase [Thermoplasmatota archaeon]
MQKVSVIITVRNEAKHIRHLLDSLVPQQHLHEVIIVDAMSTDATLERCKRNDLPIKVFQQPCTRGEGRNIGAAHATGDYLAFIDGDCMANANWLQELVALASPDTIVAGRTVMLGYWAFTTLHRVELPHKGSDTTWPSCNLLYPRRLFEELGGFDRAFITAEDIDLNYRAIEAGSQLVHAKNGIVYARARDSITGFLKQAYWNGYGRKQLTHKHGGLWHQYKLRQMIRFNGSFWGMARMGMGFLGYMRAKFTRNQHEHRDSHPDPQ